MVSVLPLALGASSTSENVRSFPKMPLPGFHCNATLRTGSKLAHRPALTVPMVGSTGAEAVNMVL